VPERRFFIDNLFTEERLQRAARDMRVRAFRKLLLDLFGEGHRDDARGASNQSI
jgi:hypothetical protein